MNDPDGYRLFFPNGSYPDPKRCVHCGSFFMRDHPSVAFCCECSRAMRIGGEEYLQGYNAQVENTRIKIPEKYVDLIDFSRFDNKAILSELQLKYNILLGFNKAAMQIQPNSRDITVTFEEIKNKVPMLAGVRVERDGTKSYKAEFTTGNGEPVN